MASLDLTALRATLTALDSALAVAADEAWLARQSSAAREVVVAGVVQNFEIVYEVAVRMIARSLASEGASPVGATLLNYRDMMRRAGEAGLIDDVPAWFAWRETRNITAHTYDAGKALEVAQGAGGFAADARRLLGRLEGRHE